MPDNLIPAFIALTGVVVSVLSSLFVSMRQTRIETQKLRNEYLHRYSGKLFEKRLEAYPKLIEHLVNFFHQANLHTIKVEDIKNLFPILLRWDSENSTFLSSESQNLMHKTYHLFFKLSESSDDELIKLITNRDSLKELRNELFKFYLALKNDLGIYSLQPPSIITEFKSPGTVIDFEKLLKSH